MVTREVLEGRGRGTTEASEHLDSADGAALMILRQTES